MSIELKMPALSPTMEKGTIAKWLVKVGDLVRPGDLIAEIETDKATMEFEAAAEGRVGEIIVPEGSEDVTVGAVIALLVEADAPAPGPEVVTTRSEAPATVAAIAPLPVTADPLVAPPLQFNPPRHDQAPGDAMRASPLARRLALQSGIDLAQVRGSGAGGRILKSDLALEPVMAMTSVIPYAQPAVSAQDYIAPAGVPYQSTKLSGMRKAIARRLTLSKQTVPHFYLSIDCRIDTLLELRGTLNEALSGDGVKLSVNDFLIKALARSLEEVPEANVQFAGDEMYQFDRVDVSMAVAIEGGLVTPVILDAGAKRISTIAQDAKALAGLARDGKLKPEQYQGGTVSISNLGMFGIERIFPVINPPQAMILGVGAGQQQMRVIDSEPVVATMLTMTASFDHRAIDGAVGARAMAALRLLVEEPVRLLA